MNLHTIHLALDPTGDLVAWGDGPDGHRDALEAADEIIHDTSDSDEAAAAVLAEVRVCRVLVDLSDLDAAARAVQAVVGAPGRQGVERWARDLARTDCNNQPAKSGTYVGNPA